MSWETKISRTVRVVNSQEMGTFARLLTAIANAGGNIGGIELLNETSHQVVRDITVFADDEASLEQILAAINLVAAFLHHRRTRMRATFVAWILCFVWMLSIGLLLYVRYKMGQNA